jgi:hypothetical protein
MISQQSDNCASVITKGGAKRMILPCVGLAQQPVFLQIKANIPGSIAFFVVVDHDGIEQTLATHKIYHGGVFRPACSFDP